LFAVLTLICTESLKVARNGWEFILIGPCFWGLAMQLVGFGVIMSVYCATHVLMSDDSLLSFSKHLNIRNFSRAVNLVPSSIFGGYVIPAILMCWTKYNPHTHQGFVAAWQGFPLFIFIIHYLSGHIIKFLHWAVPWLNPNSPDTAPRRGWSGLKQAYAVAIFVSAFTHITTLTLIASKRAFYSLIGPSVVRNFSFSTVFVPDMALKVQGVKDMPHGVLHFLQWDEYCGCAAMLLFVLYLSRDIRSASTWYGSALKVTGLILCIGPGATIVLLMWKKDRKLVELELEKSRDFKIE